MKITNPKQIKAQLEGRDTWFPYYAGYSSKFAETIVKSADLPGDAVVLDPWNGGGTTTAVTNKLGLRAHGVDLNPAMVIAAKARLLSSREATSLVPLAEEIVAKARQLGEPLGGSDPLTIWFQPSSALVLRRLERSIEILLSDRHDCLDFSRQATVNDLSGLAAFYYFALFRTVRDLAQEFVPSNPTWTTQPAAENRVRPNEIRIHAAFRGMVQSMSHAIATEPAGTTTNAEVVLHVASSEALPTASNSVDLVLTSPPYCTRIDYAVATMLELAVLRFHPNGTLDALRRSLIGTSTVVKVVPDVRADWGVACLRFLKGVQGHYSKASKTYYYKNHLQYFESMFSSMQEVNRVLKAGARGVLVVQDSYYKEVHNPLPNILAQMSQSIGLRLENMRGYEAKAVMANMNPKTKLYRTSRSASECVMVLRK